MADVGHTATVDTCAFYAATSKHRPGAPPAVGKSRCSVAISGVTKIGITKQFQLTATGLPGRTRGSYTWSMNNSNLAIVSGGTQPACTLKAGVIDAIPK